LSLPERRQVTSTARAYKMFSRSDQMVQRLQINPEQRKQMSWVDLGDDSELAAEVLNRLEKRVGKKL